MLKSFRMEQLNIIVFDRDIDMVTKEIIRLKLLHLIKIDELNDFGGDLEGIKNEMASYRYDELAKKLTNVIKKMGIKNDEFVTEDIKYISEEEAQKVISEIEIKLNPLFLDRENKKNELEKYKEIYKQLTAFPADILSVSGDRKFYFLEVLVGSVKNKDFTKIKYELSLMPHVIYPFRTEEEKISFVVIVLKKDKPVLDKAINNTSFEKLEGPSETDLISGGVQTGIRDNLDQKEAEIAVVNKEIDNLGKEYYSFLMNLRKNIDMNRLMSGAKKYFKKTQRTYLISGWVPAHDKNKVIESIQSLTNDRCYIEKMTASNVKAVRDGNLDVPVKLSNPLFLKPFETLITNYGLPEYGALDPTLFVALTFLVMFGAMFGDVGHGLVLFFVGLFLRKSIKPHIFKIATLILYGGISSVVFGFLYGSIFGFEVIRPLWINPMKDIMLLLKVALIFGIAVISLGIIVNLINSLANKNFKEGLFGKAGVIGGVIYWASIGIVIKNFIMPSLPINNWLIIIAILIPMLILIFKGPILKMLKKEKEYFPGGISDYIMEIMVELVEIFIGYLANTISFVRIGAFALAHAGLFIAVFSLSNILREKTGGVFLSVIIIILGNFLIIGLEGLVVTIQCVRLEYYEFFSKFFTGRGKEYKPIGLD